MEKNTWGGRRANQTGRPKKEEGVRKQHQIRAYDDEWVMIQAFARMIKYGRKEECRKFIESNDTKT